MGKETFPKESKAAGMKLLTRKNYETWKLNIQLLLEENASFGFVDETGLGKEPPATASETEKDKYIQRKIKSRAILINSISEEFRQAAAKHATTKAVWIHLESIFQPSTRSRKMRLLQEFCLIQRKDDESMTSFIDRVDTIGKDVEKLAMTWENMRTYILIARCGKGYENLRQIIDQWSDTDFNWTKVSQALMSEENHRRFASGTSTESKESTDSKAYTTGQWNKSQRGKSSGSRGGKSSTNLQRSSSGQETRQEKYSYLFQLPRTRAFCKRLSKPAEIQK
uniref:DUF4219 domain-containing protein n=1 Tax=Strigamia maritima TaxID=126957 RepID=T1ISI3_STRMM